jgi:hypothetical protein
LPPFVSAVYEAILAAAAAEAARTTVEPEDSFIIVHERHDWRLQQRSSATAPKLRG